jgi:hypothetical protein
MPVRWQIDHATRTVAVSAEGALGLRDIEKLLDSIEAVGTRSYRKLFDMTLSLTSVGTDDLRGLGDRIGPKRAPGPRGPVAIVAVSEEHRAQARLFQVMAQSVAHPRVKVFCERQRACEWLSAEPAEPWRRWLDNHEMA